jgi:hypothetical protein
MTARQNRYWGKWDNFGTSYVDGKNTDSLWEYNADGSLKKDKDLKYKYDAAGSNVEVRQVDDKVINSQLADGDGQVIKRMEQNLNVSGAVTTSFYVRSSVLGGRVIAEVNTSGQKQKRNIYLGTEVLASEGAGGSISWKHDNPVTGSQGVSGAGGGYSPEAEYDPSGVNVGLEAPSSGGGLFNAEMPTLIDSNGAAGNRCTLNGLRLDCEWVAMLEDNNAASQCKDNNCGSRFIKGRFVPQRTNPVRPQGYWEDTREDHDEYLVGAGSDGEDITRHVLTTRRVWHATHELSSLRGISLPPDTLDVQQSVIASNSKEGVCSIELVITGPKSPGNNLLFPSEAQSLGSFTGSSAGNEGWYWQVEIRGTVAGDASKWFLGQRRSWTESTRYTMPWGASDDYQDSRHDEPDNPNRRQQPRGQRQFFFLDAPGLQKLTVAERTSSTLVQNFYSYVERGKDRCGIKWSLTTEVRNDRLVRQNLRPYHVSLQ